MGDHDQSRTIAHACMVSPRNSKVPRRLTLPGEWTDEFRKVGIVTSSLLSRVTEGWIFYVSGLADHNVVWHDGTLHDGAPPAHGTTQGRVQRVLLGGGIMASAGAQAYMGVWGLAPSGVQGQSPWSGGQGTKSPWSWRVFWNFKFKFLMKNAPFLRNLNEMRTFLPLGGGRLPPSPPMDPPLGQLVYNIFIITQV